MKKNFKKPLRRHTARNFKPVNKKPESREILSPEVALDMPDLFLLIARFCQLE